MLKKISLVIFCMCLLTGSTLVCYAQDESIGGVYCKASEQTLDQLLEQMGLECKKGHDDEGDPYYVFKLGTRTVNYDVVLLSYNAGDSLQLYCGFSMDKRPPLEIVNDWNRENRFSRAYVDGEGDLALESDLDLEGGVSLSAIEQFISLFETSLMSFVDHVSQRL